MHQVCSGPSLSFNYEVGKHRPQSAAGTLLPTRSRGIRCASPPPRSDSPAEPATRRRRRGTLALAIGFPTWRGASARVQGPGTPPSPPTPPLSQFLALDALPSWGSDPKQPHWRHPELRRALASDDQVDELRRIRASVQESAGKAKERARSLHEAILKLNKYNNIVTRKRQHATDASSVPDKLGPASPSSSGVLRMGAQNNSAVLSKRM